MGNKPSGHMSCRVVKLRLPDRWRYYRSSHRLMRRQFGEESCAWLQPEPGSTCWTIAFRWNAKSAGGVGRKGIHRARQRRPARDAGQDALLEAAGRQAVAISPSSLMCQEAAATCTWFRCGGLTWLKAREPKAHIQIRSSNLVQVDQILSQNWGLGTL